MASSVNTSVRLLSNDPLCVCNDDDIGHLQKERVPVLGRSLGFTFQSVNAVNPFGAKDQSLRRPKLYGHGLPKRCLAEIAPIATMTDSTQRIPVWSPDMSVHNAMLDHQHIVILEISRQLWCLLSESPRPTGLAVDLLTDLAGCYQRHHDAEARMLEPRDSSLLTNYREDALSTCAQIRWHLAKAQKNELDREGLRRALCEWIESHLLATSVPAPQR